MTFYQELQLNAAGSKMLIRQSQSSADRQRHLAIYLFKVVLTLAFCVAFVSLFSFLFGNENSVAGVAVLLFIMVFRQADLGMRVKDSTVALLIIFMILIGGPKLANMLPLFPGFLVNGLCVFAMVFIGCHNLLMCNHATFLISYFLLWGNDVSGKAFVMRASGLLAGGLVTALIFYHTHRQRVYKRGLLDVIREFRPESVRGSWQIRMALGISLGVLIAQLAGLPRPMWVAFAVMSLLQPMTGDTPQRIKLRIPGTLAGGALFILLSLCIPESAQGILGLIGGLCIGFCANYGWQTVFNSFGALYSALGVYGPVQAVIIRYCTNILGAAYVLLFEKMMCRFWSRLYRRKA